MILVAVFTIAFAMAAMAYSATEIDVPSAMAVVSTEGALLALECNPAGGDWDEEACKVNGGRLDLNFWVQAVDEEPAKPFKIDKIEATANQGLQYFDIKVTYSDETSRTFRTAGNLHDVREFQSAIRESQPHCFDYTFEYRENEGKNTPWIKKSGEDCHPSPPSGSGGGGNHYGFKPGDRYTFSDLVKVTNNSGDYMSIGARLEGDLEASGLIITITAGTANLLEPDSRYGLPSGGDITVGFTFEVPENWEVPSNGLQVFNGSVVVTSLAGSGT